MAMTEYDYIIAGGGTAGCVLANRLTANGAHRVLVLEAGPTDNYLWIHIPIGYAKTMFHPRYNWGYYTEPEPSMNGRKSAGPTPAMPVGAGETCCRISSAARATCVARARPTAPTALFHAATSAPGMS
jgi:choline dehydrogenase-like flavoprotein